MGGIEQRVPSHLAISTEIQGAKFPPLLSDKDHGYLHDCTQPSPILAKSKDTEERICKSSGREWGLVVCVSQSHPFLLKSDQWPLTALIGGLYLVLSLVYHQPSASFIHIASLDMFFFFFFSRPRKAAPPPAIPQTLYYMILAIVARNL